VLQQSAKKRQAEELDAADALAEEASDKAAGSPLEPLRRDDIVAFALTSAGEVRGDGYRLGNLAQSDSKKFKDQLLRELAGLTLVVDARLGGLTDGLLNEKSDAVPRTADDGSEWLEPVDNRPAARFHIEPPAERESAKIERGTYAFATRRAAEGEDKEVLLIETWTTEESRATSRRGQRLEEHQSWAERRAVTIAAELGLTGDYAKALAIAARLHDEGKRATRWQRAFNAPPTGEVYAKTKGPIRLALLDGYRHEFGSLPCVERDAEFAALPPPLQDLVLHIVAAHHGRARPLIGTKGCEDAPPSVLAGRARDVALRFARLQREWGPWGLAWWEALLRAADQQASGENDALMVKGENAGAKGDGDGRG
jgi:CRISPR-associated endonuclease/helicase Cas3